MERRAVKLERYYFHLRVLRIVYVAKFLCPLLHVTRYHKTRVSRHDYENLSYVLRQNPRGDNHNAIKH